MDDMREQYKNEVMKMFNDICIVGDTDIVRCIGFSEDVADLYYICADRRGKICHYTFVGPCVSLKGNYERYDQLESVFTLNGSPPAKKFRHEIASDEHNWSLYKIRTVNGVIDEDWMDRYQKLLDE